MITELQLPQLPYSFDVLEPYIDARTMEIHYTKHHQTYLDNFKKVVEKYPELNTKTPEDILKDINKLPINESDRPALRNHGGGYINHSLYWSIMDPENEVDAQLVTDIQKTFESVEEFKVQFNEIATKHFGSGWAWLVRNGQGELKIYTLPNQDSPLTLGHTPIIALDIWEHAYYLKYQNKRADYIQAWWNVIKII